MKRYIYRNFDKIIKNMGVIFIVLGLIIFIFSLRPRVVLLIIGLLHIGSGVILLKLK